MKHSFTINQFEGLGNETKPKNEPEMNSDNGLEMNNRNETSFRNETEMNDSLEMNEALEMKEGLEMNQEIAVEMNRRNEPEMNRRNEPEMNRRNEQKGVEMNEETHREITEVGSELYLRLYKEINTLADKNKAQLLADMLLYLCTMSYNNQKSVRWYLNDEVRNRGLELCNTNTE